MEDQYYDDIETESTASPSAAGRNTTTDEDTMWEKITLMWNQMKAKYNVDYPDVIDTRNDRNFLAHSRKNN